MRSLTIFLDDGGVMNDNALRGREWQRLIGEFFPPRLGGRRADWEEANLTMFVDLWDRQMMKMARLGLVDAYKEWSRQYQLEWLRTMSARVGVAPPADDDEAFALAVEAARFVTSNCRSAYADAVPAIRELVRAGFTLNTASGEDSGELHGYLSCMGVRPLFTHLFGPDLVDAFKAGPAYYSRAFERADLDPVRCLVVDDAPQALTWAASAGAATVLVDRKGAAQGYEGQVVRDLGALPRLAESIDSVSR